MVKFAISRLVLKHRRRITEPQPFDEQQSLITSCESKYPRIDLAIVIVFLNFLGIEKFLIQHHFCSPVSHLDNAVTKNQTSRTIHSSDNNDNKNGSKPLSCMPALNRGVPYVLNLVKKWKRYHREGDLPPLVIYVMYGLDLRNSIFSEYDSNLSWLTIVDSGLMYAGVLHDCARRGSKHHGNTIEIAIIGQDRVGHQSEWKSLPNYIRLWERTSFVTPNVISYNVELTVLCFQSLLGVVYGGYYGHSHYLAARYWTISVIVKAAEYLEIYGDGARHEIDDKQ